MQQAIIVRLFTDEGGESHFDEINYELTPVNFAPPAAPLNFVSLFPTAQCSFIGGTSDWAGDIPHPAPRRQVFCTLQGQYTITASDGEIRSFPVGSILLLEDTRGKGHSTRLSEGPTVLVFVVTLDA